jgi:type IV secretion system protein VirB8
MSLVQDRPPPAAAFRPRPVLDDPDLLRAYFDQVASFEADRLRSCRRTARLGFAAGLGGVLVGLAGVTAAASILPLTTVLPLVFRVDNTTGAVERVYDLQGGELAASEATRRYFLWQYVRHRQGYVPAEAQADFEAVSLLSAPAVQQAYAAEVHAANPESPPARLGPDGTAVLRWVSTAFLGPKLAQVRFVQRERQGDADLPPRRMVATIGFDFAAGSLSGSAINVNPLGFLVTSYHADQEAVP